VKANLVFTVALLVGCSDPVASAGSAVASSSGSAPSSAKATTAAPITEKEREAVAAFFADVGERGAAAMKKVAETKPKSKVAYAEALLLVTPVAFPAHKDLFAKHGLDLERFTVLMADPAVEEKALSALRAKVEPVQKELAMQDLPATDPEGCITLARRLVELQQAGPSQAPLGRALAPSLVSCVPVMPKHVGACLPTNPANPTTVEAFDACVAAGPKKPSD
jgi:hypothetical protein